MRRRHSIGFVGAVVVAACGGGSGGNAAPMARLSSTSGTDTSGDEDVMVPIGGCRETPVNAEVKRVDGANTPWAYVVVHDAEVECQEQRVLIKPADGLAVIVASFRDDAQGSNVAQIGPVMLGATEADFQRMDPQARLSDAHDVTLGESQRAARCGRLDFAKDGQALVTHVCAAWATTPARGQSHAVLVMFTNTDAGNQQAGIDVPELMGNMVDALVIDPQPLP